MAGKGSEVGGCAKCAKICLIVFNVIFCLIGIGLMACGIYAYIELSDYLDIVGNKNVNAPAIVLIAFGCITFIIAAMGCFGAYKESACLLFTFAAIIGILLVAEIAAGIAAVVFRAQIEQLIKDNAMIFMKDYKEGADTAATDTWDTLQTKLKCCGFNSSQDWLSDNAPLQDTIPKSCDGHTGDGCIAQAIQFVEQNIYVVAGAGIGFGLVELIGIVLACCVGCNIRKLSA